MLQYPMRAAGVELLACMAGVKATNHLWIHEVIVDTV